MKKKMKPNKPKIPVAILRVVVEMGSIIFLFYSNLLMGEYTQSNSAQGKSFLFAVKDIFTATNFAIAIVSSLIGYVIFEHFRKKI